MPKAYRKEFAVSMKKKMNHMLMLLVTSAIFLTLVFSTIIYYHMFGRLVMEVLPGILLIAGGLVLICLPVTHYLTGKLLPHLEQLAENRDENSSAKMRQEFTANVSHELKTPLTSISGYAELIENGMASESDVTRFAQGIHKSANRLLTLINDIIRLSELDSEDQEISMEAIDLYELAETCVEMLMPNAEKRQVTISMCCEEQPLENEKEDPDGQSGELQSCDCGMEKKCRSTCIVKGNKQMLEELLYNLCENAICYNNPNGKVWVDVRPMEKGVCLTVQDTGIGIPAEHRERIFERFYRVDKSRSKQTGGTGLGLAIVKHIIARHDATLELDSESGQGTTVRVIFCK